MKYLISTILAAALLSLVGCASKPNRLYVGQCAFPGHWFCGEVYDSFADCNNARKRHDFETSRAGTCYSGSKEGRPDGRSM